MKLIIDIPEEIHKALEQGSFGAKYNMYDLVGCIMNGTPLPKGHGRLGDLDALEVYFRNVRAKLNKDDYKTAVEYFTRDNMLLNTEQFIHLVPTIIEADNWMPLGKK